MNANSRNKILLTGAGFTANFGGLLGREMWAKIFNDSRLNSLGNAKLLLRTEFNFENVYSEIVENKDYENERDLFQEIIISAYKNMDDSLLMLHPNINNVVLNRFLDIFLSKSGVWFTLNQDRFLERHLNYISEKNESLVPEQMQYKNNISDFDNPKITPTDDELTQFTKMLPARSWYIKLHGSLGWYSQKNKNCMVLGINKPERIDEEPLLKWYFSHFNELLKQDGAKIVIIGYGFLDKHINGCIVSAVGKTGEKNWKNKLKLYIVSPERPSDFRKRLIENKSIFYNHDNRDGCSGLHLWNAVEGYFPHELTDIFPYSAGETDMAVSLRKIFAQ